MIWIRRLLVLLGTAIILIAARGAWTALSGPELWHYLRFLLLGWLANDLLLLPAAICVGWVASRWLPAVARPIVQAALLASLVVTLIGYPMIVGKGFSADNPSALPRDYRSGLALILGLIWLAAALAIAVRQYRHRRLNTAAAHPSTLEKKP
jgi:hypothetical protein